MANYRTKIMHPSTLSQFNPEMDTPLRDYPTKDAFVRCSAFGNYSLYCYGYLVIRFDRDWFIYTFPSYRPHYQKYVETYLSEYAPHVNTNNIQPYLGKLKYEYIGRPKLVTA